MEIVTINGQKSFFGVTMTDFNPVDKVGSIMCCQDADTFLAISLSGLETTIPSGSPFFATGDSHDESDGNFIVNLDQPGHRWLVFDKKYLDRNYLLKIDNAVDRKLSDDGPIDQKIVPTSLSYKNFRKNMIGFRIISTELKGEDMTKYNINLAPKYIKGKAYHYYFRQQLVSTESFILSKMTVLFRKLRIQKQ